MPTTLTFDSQKTGCLTLKSLPGFRQPTSNVSNYFEQNKTAGSPGCSWKVSCHMHTTLIPMLMWSSPGLGGWVNICNNHRHKTQVTVPLNSWCFLLQGLQSMYERAWEFLMGSNQMRLDYNYMDIQTNAVKRIVGTILCWPSMEQGNKRCCMVSSFILSIETACHHYLETELCNTLLYCWYSGVNSDTQLYFVILVTKNIT